MKQNVEQHHAFTPGINSFVKYVNDCVKTDGSGTQYDAHEFRRLIDAFGLELATHLGQEIETLLALEKYDVRLLKREFKRWDEVQQRTDKVCYSLPSCRNTVVCFKDAFLIGFLNSQYYSPWYLGPVMMTSKAEIPGLTCPFSCRTWWTIGLQENIAVCGGLVLVQCGQKRGILCLGRRFEGH